MKHYKNHDLVLCAAIKWHKGFVTIAGLCAATLTLASVSVTPVMAADPNSVAIAKPAEGTHILLIKPEITLNMLTLNGMKQPKVEWSQSAQANMISEVSIAIAARKLQVDMVAADVYDTSRALQVIKLNEAVTASIFANRNPLTDLPTKTDFAWTLGEGAASLLPPAIEGKPQPKYALFISGEGTYSSSKRAVMAVGMAMLLTGVPMGGQTLKASLVDLQTGQIVWAQSQFITPGVDIREPDGAHSAVKRLLEDMPF